jgi:hypothetical protein
MVETFDTVEDLKAASNFMRSMRGRYILAQALYYGIRALKEVQPDVMQEKSNIDDMQYLQSTLFNFPDFLFEEQMAQNKGEQETVVYPV